MGDPEAETTRPPTQLAPLHQKHIDLGDHFTGTLKAFLDLLQQRFGVCVIEYFCPAIGHLPPFL
jgi:hypothetical protein